jgi:hypothetical protein
VPARQIDRPEPITGLKVPSHVPAVVTGKFPPKVQR